MRKVLLLLFPIFLAGCAIDEKTEETIINEPLESPSLNVEVDWQSFWDYENVYDSWNLFYDVDNLSIHDTYNFFVFTSKTTIEDIVPQANLSFFINFNLGGLTIHYDSLSDYITENKLYTLTIFCIGYKKTKLQLKVGETILDERIYSM